MTTRPVGRRGGPCARPQRARSAWHALAATAALLSLATLARAQAPLPLPDAPVRLVIPDVRAFDAALGGAFRAVLEGTLSENDPAYAAWRQTLVGTKLAAQWGLLSGDLPWTWKEIVALQARAIGVALLDVGQLEAVVAIDSPLAKLPLPPKLGQARTHAGVSYQLVTPGAGDAPSGRTAAAASSEAPERRAGLAWARVGDVLLVATSERALRQALDESAAGRSFAAPLPGLASLELDLDRLRADRFFKREFRFPPGPETGRLRAALRQEEGRFVEVREGTGDPRSPGYDLALAGAAVLAWEPDGATLWPALRRGILEPIPDLVDRPHTALAGLPSAARAASNDPYLTRLTERVTKSGGSPTDEGELPRWREFLAAHPVPGWGLAVDRDGNRAVAVPWPRAADDELLALCHATAARRLGRVEVARVGDVEELRAGADLPVIALRRTGDFVWIAGRAEVLAPLAEPRRSADRVRWASVDLAVVRAERPRWERAEGPASPERARTLSDRVAGALGWIPDVSRVLVERRATPAGWTETVTFDREPLP